MELKHNSAILHGVTRLGRFFMAALSTIALLALTASSAFAGFRIP